MPSSLRGTALNRALRRTAAVAAALLAIVLTLVLLIAWIGISVDAPALRDRTASWLTQRLGREVRLDGPLHLEISAHPSLVMRDLHVANATGFAASELASLGEARLALDLWSLLRMRLRVDELSGRDARCNLQVDGQGRNNWTFQAPGARQDVRQDAQEDAQEDAQKAAQTAAQTAAGAALDGGNQIARLLAALDVRRVSLQELNVEFLGADARHHYFELQSLVARLPAGQPISLALQGKIERSFPYRLDLTGGTLADLGHPEIPWPVELSLAFLSSRLTLQGKVAERTGALHFELGTQDLGEFDRLLQTRLPPVGAVDLTGVIDYAPGRIRLHEFGGRLGQTMMQGTLELDRSALPPGITGALEVPVLDLRPFLAAQPVDKTDPPRDLAEVYRELSRAAFHLNDLKRIDADLTLQVGRWLSLPGSVHDAALALKLAGGRLDMQVRATVADVALAGSASADANAEPPRFGLALGARDSRLGNLAGVLLGLPDVQGFVERLDLRAAARGDSGAELMQSLELRLNVANGRLTYGNGPGARPVRFTLSRLALALPAGRPAEGAAQGALLDTPFRAALHAGRLVQLMQEAQAPIDLDLQAGSARASLQAVLQPASADAGPTVAFRLDAPHSAEVADWLGLQRGADVPVRLQGDLRTSSAGWHLTDLALHLGRSDLTADIRRTVDAARPLLAVRVASDLLDADELQSVLPQRPQPAPGAGAATFGAANLIDIPILPHGISLADTDIDVRVQRVASAGPLDVRALRFEGRIRDGAMSAAPFAALVVGVAFQGSIAVDLRTDQPRTTLTLSADRLDVGSLLAKLGIARHVEAGVEHLDLQMDLRSSRLGQILAQSELAVRFAGGHVELQDANTGAKRRIDLDSGALQSSAGAPVRLDLRGALDRVPATIGIRTAQAADLIDPGRPVPFEVLAESSGISFGLTGSIDRPFSDKDFEVALDVHGDRLDRLDRLAGALLPPWGPWSLTGRLQVSARGYELPALRLQVGSSRLDGHGSFLTTHVPPRADLTLTAPRIQIDDFRLGDWTPEKPRPAGPGKPATLDDLEASAAKEGDEVQAVLSPALLRRQDAYLTLHVDQVLSGPDALGNGSLEAKLEHGQLAVGPLLVDLPGGSARLQFDYRPDDAGVDVRLRAIVNRFDYGVLARRIDPGSDMRGTFSLDMDVGARAHRVSELLRNGKGRIDFAVWPQNQKSGLLDLWAVNIVTALLPAVDPASESKVNCAVARFVLNDGKLSEKTILVDTSRMRVTGKGGVDFGAEDVQFYMQPRAKTPQFLSFALPIELSGKVNDYHVGVRAADLLETAVQLATSVLRVPMQLLFAKETPADGRDVCAVEFK